MKLYIILSVVFLLHSSLAVQAPDNRGTDFFVAFAYNYINGLGQTQDLFISSDVANQVQLTTKSGTLATLNIAAQTTVTYDVSSIYIPNENTVGNYGIRVHSLSGLEFTLVGLNTYPATTDGFLAFPIDVLGTDYIAAGYTACCGVAGYLYVVAPSDGTVVQISGSHNLDGLGSSVTFNLNSYQTVLVGSVNGDITGFSVTSNNPIALFSGSACSDIPTNVVACNVLVDQIPPTNTWDQDFITVPIATRSAGDVFRVVSAQAGTVVTLGGNTVATLGRGQFYEFQSAAPNVIHTSHPALVMQYDKGSSADGANSDPFQIWIPPTNQFAANYYVTAPTSSVWTNWISVVVPSGEQSGLNIDGHALSGTWHAISGTSYVYTSIQVSGGSHHVYHNSPIVPFEVTSYGFSSYDGYGYVGGNRLAPLQNPCTPTPTVPGDGIDNDCDGRIDEEIRNGIDDDGDGLIDEDLAADTCCYSSTIHPSLSASGSTASTTIACGSAIPSAPTVTATVDCQSPSSFTVQPTVTTTGGSCPQDSTITRVWSVSDTCGRTATLTQVITVSDSVAPSLTVPNDASFQCGSSFSTDISSTGNAQASDSCDPNPSVSHSDQSTQSSCFNGVGSIARTFTATDACGNTASGTQHITIQDTTAPSLTVPNDVTFECGTSFSTDISSTGNAQASDSCDPNPSVSHSDQSTQSSCFNGVGSIARTFTATDSCGNTATPGTQQITIQDTTAPSISTTNQCIFPPNGVTHCYGRGDLLTSFSDTCSIATVAPGVSSQSGFYYDSVDDLYCVTATLGADIAISFTATDECNNQASSTAHVTAPATNNNCGVFTSCDGTITGVSVSTAVFTNIDAYGYEYAPQYEAAVTITVQEPVALTNWRLEIHFPYGDELVRYSQYDVYTDGTFKCESSTRNIAVVSPQPWAMSVANGGSIVVEYVATNNGRLTADQIRRDTQLYVFTAN